MMGLASGMDTEFIIQQTMRLHQMKIDSRLRARTILEWRQQTHNSIRDQITGFRNSFLTTQGAGLLNRNAFNSTSATVTGRVSGANSNAVTVRTTIGSPTGSFTINKAVLAQNAQAVSSSPLTGLQGNGFASGERLGDMLFAGNAQDGDWNRHVGFITVGEGASARQVEIAARKGENDEWIVEANRE